MLFYSGFVLLMSDLPLGPASPVITQWPVFSPSRAAAAKAAAKTKRNCLQQQARPYRMTGVRAR